MHPALCDVQFSAMNSFRLLARCVRSANRVLNDCCNGVRGLCMYGAFPLTTTWPSCHWYTVMCSMEPDSPPSISFSPFIVWLGCRGQRRWFGSSHKMVCRRVVVCWSSKRARQIFVCLFSGAEAEQNRQTKTRKPHPVIRRGSDSTEQSPRSISGVRPQASFSRSRGHRGNLLSLPHSNPITGYVTQLARTARTIDVISLYFKSNLAYSKYTVY